MSNRPLLVRPEAGESFRGFVLRLAQRNGTTSQLMCEWLDLPTAREMPKDVPSRMPELVRVERETLVSMGLDGTSTPMVLGQAVPFLHMLPQFCRVCPACLAENAYHRRVWDVRHVANCPIHRRPLIARCPDPECGRELKWRRWFVDACSCGRPLASVNGPTVDECAVEQVVYTALGIPGVHLAIPPFDGMGLADTLELLLFLGRLVHGIDRPESRGLPRARLVRDRRVIETGLEIVRGWPASFEALATSVRKARPEHRSLSLQYGPLHRFIERAKTAPYGEPLRNAYRDHLLRRGDIAPKDFPIFLARPEEAAIDWMTRAEIMRTIGGSGMGTKILSGPHADGLMPVEGVGTGRALYRREDVRGLVGRLDDLILMKDARAMLGVRRHDVAALIDDGILTQLKSSDDGKVWRRSVSLRQVRALLEEIRSCATADAPKAKTGFFDLVLLLTNRRDGGFIDVWRAIRSRELPAHLPSTSKPSFQALTFEGLSAMALVRRLRGVAQEEWLILRDFAREVGIRQNAIPALVRMGHLPEPRRDCTALLLPRSAIDAFRQDLVSSKTLAEEHGRDTKAVTAEMLKLGLTLVVPDYRQHDGSPVFWRGEVEQALRKKPSDR